jgi:hypothetical protein
MAARIEGLREQVRQTLTMASPRLAQLAALDAVLEQTLGAREQKAAGVSAGFAGTTFCAVVPV